MIVLGAAFPHYWEPDGEKHKLSAVVIRRASVNVCCWIKPFLSNGCKRGVEVTLCHDISAPPAPPKHRCLQWAAGMTHSGLLFSCGTLMEQALAKNGCVKTVVNTDGGCAWPSFLNIQISSEWCNQQCVEIPNWCSKSTSNDTSLNVAQYLMTPVCLVVLILPFPGDLFSPRPNNQ